MILALLAAFVPAGPGQAQTNPLGGLTGQAAPTAPPAETAPAQSAGAQDIDKLVKLLEDEERRAELIKLLKLMGALEAEIPAPTAAQAEVQTAAEAKAGLPPLLEGDGMLRSFGDIGGKVYMGLSRLTVNISQSVLYFKSALKAAWEPGNRGLWLPFVAKFCVWALILMAITAVFDRKMAPSRFHPTAWGRLWALSRYMVVVAGPSVILILSCYFIPALATEQSGTMWFLNKALRFIQDFVQGFFVALAAVYICLKLAQGLLKPNREGRAIINMRPQLAKHLLNSWRVMSVYCALFGFLKATVIKHFALVSLPYALNMLLILPIPIYLTVRVINFQRLSGRLNVQEQEAVRPDEAEEGGEDESAAGETDGVSAEAAAEVEREAGPIYRVDEWMKAHWGSIIIFYTWALSLLAMYRQSQSDGRFMESLVASLAVIVLTGIIITLERFLTLKLVSWGSEHGRGVILAVDNFFNVVVGFLALLAILAIWGLPLGTLIKSPVTLEIFSRGFTIALTVGFLIVFLKFSNLVASWFLSGPDVPKNRTWRTMVPLIQTTLRALAIFVALVVVLERLGVNVGPILAGAGILGLGVGMGAQSLIKDIINGASILLMNSLAVGDYVQIGAIGGTVEAVGLRTVRLRDPSGNLAIIPNSQIDSIINMTKDFSQEIIDLLLPYDADPDKMLALIKECAKTLERDPYWGSLLISPPEVLGVLRLEEKGTTIRIRLSTEPGVQWAAGRELKLRLKRALLKAGVKAPYQQVVMIDHPVINVVEDEEEPRAHGDGQNGQAPQAAPKTKIKATEDK